VHLAPVATAELVEVAVRAGDRVTEGQIVARQEQTDAEIALAEAEAARDQAAAELANLREGSRPEEIAVLDASLQTARVRLAEAERAAERQSSLARSGIVSQAVLDSVVAERDMAASSIIELEARLSVARLPAREGEVKAAESRLRGAEAAARQASWRLERRVLAAPVAGEVADVFRRAGELVGPTVPVISILPDGGTKLVVYVPETQVAGIALGQRLAGGCDACAPGPAAVITSVADAPEYTPPVIYSVPHRQTLVYRVAARPAGGAETLRPGQIVDVRPAP
jgi:HlyD family secretion protein